MSALGHKRTFAVQNGMSALPPKATAKADIGALEFMSAKCQKRTLTTRPVLLLLTGHISHRYRPECGNCGLSSVTLFVNLQVGWRDVGKDAAQRVQPTCLTGCKAAHRTSLAAVIETITECATTNN